MTTNPHRCKNCGYILEAPDAHLCFPCLVADSKSKMLTGLSCLGIDGVNLNFDAAADTRRLQAATVPKVKKERVKSKNKIEPNNTTLNDVRLSAYKNRKVGGASGLICVLCGARIEYGKLLAHKENVHGEARFSQSKPHTTGKKSDWVSIVQGGLPGLGKRR